MAGQKEEEASGFQQRLVVTVVLARSAYYLMGAACPLTNEILARVACMVQSSTSLVDLVVSCEAHNIFFHPVLELSMIEALVLQW